VDSLEVDVEPPQLLSQTGLYADIAAKTVAAYAEPFTPRFELWSDAADKSRWVYLPECGVIDTSDMDDWSLPVGTRLWKEFVVDGMRVETRLVERVGTGPNDFLFAAYVWNDDETEATIAPDGVPDARGTTHDVPDAVACRQCHGSDTEGGGRPSRALGFSALQLGNETLDDLMADGVLTDAPQGPYEAPGSAAEAAALGYLHANCGNCHNATVDAAEPIDLDLWVSVDDESVEDTGAYRTAVGVPNTVFNDQHVTARIEPGVPDQSAVVFRMGQRGNTAQMPPVATEVMDGAGLDVVVSWIEAMP
jgi:mono/diheme cytochrome c family protein